MAGMLVFDIDGTLTLDLHHISKKVVSTLNGYAQEGWQLLFLTGRTFQWAAPIFQTLTSPYLLGLQNGAVILEMPEKKIVSKCLLPVDILPQIDTLLKGLSPDYALFSGYEQGDKVYFRKKRYDAKTLKYVMERGGILNEEWIDIESWDELKFTSFASLKWMGLKTQVQKVAHTLEHKMHIHIPINKDPFDPNYCVAQATHPNATKGKALKMWMDKHPHKRPVIAAGDDWNDYEMLQEADIKIVIEGAPIELLEMADVIAPSPQTEGIIQGLYEAVKK